MEAALLVLFLGHLTAALEVPLDRKATDPMLAVSILHYTVGYKMMVTHSALGGVYSFSVH